MENDLNALLHHPHDLTPKKLADLRLWALKRRYFSLLIGPTAAGAFGAQAYLRGRPLQKL